MKYLKVFTDLRLDVEPLSNEELGILFRAMLKYAGTGEEPDLTGDARFYWGNAKKTIDAQREAYERRSQANRENIAQRWSDTNRINNNDTNGNKTMTMTMTKTYEQDYLSKERYNAPTLEEVEKYVKENGLQMDPERFVDYYDMNGWVTKAGKPIANWKAAVRNWAKRQKEFNNGNDESATLGGTRYPAGVTPQTVSGTGKFKLI